MKSELKDDENGVQQMESSENNKLPVTCCFRMKKIIEYFTIEPFLFCYILPNIVSAITTQHFNIKKACRVDLNYNETLCDLVAETELNDSDTLTAFIEAQKLVANMASWSLPIQYGFPALMILFVGGWSDRTGNRKTLMLLPIVGEIVSSVGMLLATWYFSVWPLWVIGLIECLPTALSGGLSVALMGGYSYITDVTSPESRTFRMGLVGVIVTLGVPLGSSIGGILTKTCGYFKVYIIILSFYLIGLMYTLLRIRDVNRIKVKGTLIENVIQFIHPRNVWDTIAILFKNHGAKLLQVLLVILAHIIITGPVFGESSVLYLYLTNKFQMEIVEFSLFSTYSVLMGIVGTAVAITVFCKLLNIHDTLLGIIGSSCKVISSFIYGLAPTKQWFYSGPAFDFFGGTGVLAVRSLGTKLVDPSDIGKFCSILGLVEGLAPVIYGPIYNNLYANTLETIPGAFYVVGASMTVPAVLIFIYLYIVHKQTERNVVKNPHEKEMHAYDNDLTKL